MLLQPFQQQTQFATHQCEVRIQLGFQRFAIVLFQFLGGRFQELQLAHHHVLAQHEGKPLGEHQPKVITLLARFQVFGDFGGGKFLSPRLDDGALIHRIAQFAFVAQCKTFRKFLAADPAGEDGARAVFGIHRQRREGAERLADRRHHGFGILAAGGIDN